MAIKEVGQNASEISSKAVSETAPTNGQVLKYNSSSEEWEPGAETDTNTQLTQEQVEDFVNGVIVAGSNVTKTYDDAAGTLTIAASGGAAALAGIDDQSSSNDDQITIKDGEVVINEDSDSLDFRVESNGNDHMLLVDGSAERVGVAIKTPPKTFSVCPVQYETGTASQSGTTVTGSGTTWTDAMVGSEFVYADGTTSGAITARGSNTSITVTTSQTVSSQAYKIHYQGLQVESTGHVGIGTTGSDPDSLLHVWAPDESTAAIHLETGGESAADPRMWFHVSGATSYGMGIDNDDGDSFKITEGSSGVLGGNPRIVVQKTTGNVGIGTTDPAHLVSIVGAVGNNLLITSPHATDGTSGIQFGNYTATMTTNQKGAVIFQRDGSDGSIRGKLHLCVDTSTDSGNAGVADAALTAVHGGNVGIGTTDPDSLLEVAKDSADAEVLVSAYHDTEATTPKVTFRKADGSEASPALVDDDAVLGTIDFLAYDGTNFERGAKIEARVDGTPSDGSDMPTELTFWTTPDASATCVERLALKPDGRGLSAFTCSGWVHFDGTTNTAGNCTIADSHNVSSVGDSGVGYYVINWDVDLADANYAIAGTCTDISYGATVSVYAADAANMTTALVKIRTGGDGSQADSARVMVTAFGGN